MTDTTHADLARKLQQERAELIVLLSDARSLLAGATVHIEAVEHYAPHLGCAKDYNAKINAFLDRGLFGDRA